MEDFADSEALEAGILPTLEACLAHTRTLAGDRS